MNNTVEQIKNKLESKNIPYTLHKVPEGVGVSVEEHIKAFGLNYSDGCATLVFSTDNGFVALMRRDDTRINNTLLRKALGTNKLRFATPEELKEVTGFEIGMVSPLLLNIPIYIDKKVLEKETVRVGSGGNEFSLEIKVNDLLKITGAIEIDVTEIDKMKTNSNNLRVLSGITPSSSKGLHLGNYLGAVKPHVEFQDKGQCLYFIADYHALNTVFNAATFRNNVIETYIDYLALGIDLERTIFFVESHVKEIFELTEILNNVISLSQMKRMHAFKDKLQKPDEDVEQINMGLFTYPILMSADILAFEPDIVPVGEDQTQHVEVTRDIAKNFNNRYGDTLKIPELYVKKSVARVPGTDGERKMSKSLGNDLTIFASEDELKKQIMNITTDPGRIKKDDPGDPTKNVIFTYLKLMDFDSEKFAEYETSYMKGTIGDVELKQKFLVFFLEYFDSYRKKRAELARDKEKIEEIMRDHGIRASEIAKNTMQKVRTSIGAIY